MSAIFHGTLNATPLLTMDEFKNKAPLFVIDCSRQRETVKYGPIDVRLELESNSEFPAKTTAHCIIIHDTVFEYQPLSNITKKYEG